MILPITRHCSGYQGLFLLLFFFKKGNQRIKTTYQCENCKNIHTEIQHPGDEQFRNLDLCDKCRKLIDHFPDSTKMIIKTWINL